MMTVLDFTCWSWVVDIGIFSEFDDFMKIDSAFKVGILLKNGVAMGLPNWWRQFQDLKPANLLRFPGVGQLLFDG
jgi:hypothetical protein